MSSAPTLSLKLKQMSSPAYVWFGAIAEVRKAFLTMMSIFLPHMLLGLSGMLMDACDALSTEEHQVRLYWGHALLSQAPQSFSKPCLPIHI